MCTILYPGCCLLGWLQGRQGQARQLTGARDKWQRQERAGKQRRSGRRRQLSADKGTMVTTSEVYIPVLSPETCGRVRDGLIRLLGRKRTGCRPTQVQGLNPHRDALWLTRQNMVGCPRLSPTSAVGPAEERWGTPRRPTSCSRFDSTRRGHHQGARCPKGKPAGQPHFLVLLACGVMG